MWDLSSPGSHTLHCKMDFQPLDQQGSPFSTSFDHNYSRHLSSTYSVPDAKLSFSHALSHLSFQRNPGASMAMPTLSSSAAQLCLTLCDPMDCSTPGFSVYHQIPELAQTHVHRVSDAIQPSHPLSSPSPPAFYLSQHQGLFQWVSSLHQVAKILKFSFSISPSNEYSGLISFRIDWLDLLAVHGTLKSLLQQHSSKALILWRSAFFTVQLSHPYMTTGKTIALTNALGRWSINHWITREVPS